MNQVGAASRAEIWEAVARLRAADPSYTPEQVVSALRQVEALRELSWFYSVAWIGGAP